MQSLVENYSMNSPSRGTKLSPDAIVSRILFALVNEGFKILEDGIASDPSKIDIIYLYGYGWPAWRGKLVHPCYCKYFITFILSILHLGTEGGPMFWADNYVGLPVLLRELETFHKMYPDSEYFRPSQLLRRCVELGVGVQEYYRKGLQQSAVISKL